MAGSDLSRIALRFVNEINRHDVDAVLALVSSDHVFVDSLGRELRGKDRIREEWTHHFARFPDYRIVIEDTLRLGVVVGLIGVASGTYCREGGELPSHHRWRIPSAWKAVVRDGQVERWQVFADHDPVRKIVEAARPPS